MIFKDDIDMVKKWNEFDRSLTAMGMLGEDRNDIFIAAIVKLLRNASEAYYTTGDAILTDQQYDSFERDLKILDPDNAQLQKVGTE